MGGSGEVNRNIIFLTPMQGQYYEVPNKRAAPNNSEWETEVSSSPTTAHTASLTKTKAESE